MIKFDSVYIDERKVKYQNLNYEFNKGVYHITGPNGCGKTSLFEALVKEVNYTGEIHICNQNLNKITKEEIQRNYIAYVRQESNIIEKLTVLENFDLFIEDSELLDYYIDIFKIRDIVNLKASKLSGGELKKVNIIIGLCQKCPILILDEPDNHLDTASINTLISCIESYDGVVLLTTHSTDNLQDYTHVDLVEMPTSKVETIVDLEVLDKQPKQVNRQYIKKFQVKPIFILCSIFFILFIVFMCYSYWNQNLLSSTFNNSSDNQVYNDNVFVIEPPLENNLLTAYGSEAWFENTPYLLGQDIIDQINNSGLAKKTIGLNYDLSISQSRVDYKGETYYLDKASAPSYSKAIAEQFHTFATQPSELEGSIPDDYTNEVIIPKSYKEKHNIEIGDTISLTGRSGENTHEFKYKVVGINNSDLASEIELAYGGDEYFEEGNVNINKQARQDEVEFIAANSGVDPDEIKDSITNQNYYHAIYVEAKNEKDAIKLINALYEYDPYLAIESNHGKKTGQVAKYKREFLVKQINLTSIVLCIVVILSFILLWFETKLVKEKYANILYKNGFDNKQINLVWKRVHGKYIKFLIVIFLINLSASIMYKNIQMGFILAIELLLYIIIFYLIRRRAYGK